MVTTWKDPTYRGSHFVESVLSGESLNASDPMAVLRVKQAITDAQVWLWSQFDWFWAVSPNSPARFEIFPETTVVKDSPVGTTLNVADTGEFKVDDTIVIDEGDATKRELATVSAIVAGVSLTLAANLKNSHDADDAAIVRPLRPVVFDKAVRTRIDTDSSGSTVSVEHTQGFAVDDLIVIDPGGAAVEIRRIKTITDTSGGSFTIYGTLDSTHTLTQGHNVYKATESDPKFDLTVVNGGVMNDFGRATKVLIAEEGPLRPVNRSRWRASREDRMSGGVGIGDGYVIEGNPPEFKLLITPTSNKTVVVHYLRAPTQVFGDDDIQCPFPFHNLLRWLSRIFYQKNGPAGGALLQDQDVMAELTRLRGFDSDLAQPSGMRPLTGMRHPELIAAVHGAAVLPLRFETDFN